MKTPLQPSIDELKLTSVLHALSDPIRLSIVRSLAKTKEQHCASYCSLNISKSTVSHHFRVLREAGVIQVRIEGTQHFYSLRTNDLNKLFPGLLTSILRVSSSHM
ncbi:ArsR/SmtB family transcription factor [Ectobacillus sp. sgz5001026]|uniref:ArsR/SmtB family transcription factor n=1 Tax=Ectobacillus sp. sgz5001026 TaxID=3242473 RepID=UPI0036D225D8